VRQDSLILYYDYALGKLPNWNNATKQHVYHMKNRVTQKLVDGVEYCLHKATKDGFGEITKFINILLWTLKESIDVSSRYRELHIPSSPSVTITEAGRIVYKEINRRGVKDMEGFAEEMKKPSQISAQTVLARHEAEWASREAAQLHELGLGEEVVAALKKRRGADLLEQHAPPLIHLRTMAGSLDPTHQAYDAGQTKHYLSVMKKVATDGISFVSRVALVTGCGADSLGIEIVKGTIL
jgi:fatty acid synthase subunit alpha